MEQLRKTEILSGTSSPESLLKRADQEIFIKAPVLTQDFSEHQGFVNEFVRKDTLDLIQEYFIYGGYGTDVLFSLDPAAEAYRNPNIRLSFNSVWKGSRSSTLTGSLYSGMKTGSAMP